MRYVVMLLYLLIKHQDFLSLWCITNILIVISFKMVIIDGIGSIRFYLHWKKIWKWVLQINTNLHNDSETEQIYMYYYHMRPDIFYNVFPEIFFREHHIEWDAEFEKAIKEAVVKGNKYEE